MDLAIAGYFSVQSLLRRVRICALPASSRACIRYPSSLSSCNQSWPSGAVSTSLASCGLIQAGEEASGTLRRVGIVSMEVVRADFGIAFTSLGAAIDAPQPMPRCHGGNIAAKTPAAHRELHATA